MPRCLESWFRGVCAAVALSLAGGSAALAQQPLVPPAQPGLIDQARDAATDAATKAREATEKAVKTFADTLQGQSVLVGITQTQTELKLNYHSPSASAVATVESYSGDPSLGYLVSLESAAKESWFPIGDSGVWQGAMGFRLATSYGTFALRQTLQKGSAGKTEGGEVQGEYLGFAIPVQFWIVRNSPTVPLAIGWGVGLGKAFLRYEAPLHYSDGSQDFKVHVQNDGYYARDLMFGGMEFRLSNVLLRWQKITMSNGESFARSHGRRVFTFSDDFALDVKTLAYVFNF